MSFLGLGKKKNRKLSSDVSRAQIHEVLLRTLGILHAPSFRKNVFEASEKAGEENSDNAIQALIEKEQRAFIEDMGLAPERVFDVLKEVPTKYRADQGMIRLLRRVADEEVALVVKAKLAFDPSRQAESSKHETCTHLYYNTFSICLKCAIGDKKGFRWQETPAVVQREGDNVWLIKKCKTHGEERVLYCSSVAFFERVLSYTTSVTNGAPVRISPEHISPSSGTASGGRPPLQKGNTGGSCGNGGEGSGEAVKVPQQGTSAGVKAHPHHRPAPEPFSDIADLEDLRGRCHMKSSQQDFMRPLVAELKVFRDGFASEDEIRGKVQSIVRNYPEGQQFVLRVNAGLADDMNVLNSRLKFVDKILPDGPMLLEASFERLIMLSRLPDTVLFNTRVYPGIRYFVEAGATDMALRELRDAVAGLKTISDIQIMVTLCIDRPFPDLSVILSFLRSEVGFVRGIVISPERSPKQLVEESMKVGSSISSSVDPYDLLLHIQEWTSRDGAHAPIMTSDFTPLRVFTVFEPFLKALGYGNYKVRPSPYCGFCVGLINTKSHRSKPVTQYANLDRLYSSLLPLLPQLAKINPLKLWTMVAVRKIVSQSLHAGMSNIDFFSYMVDKSKQQKVIRFLRATQFLVVHNNMDIGSVDMLRRCECLTITNSSVDANSVAATCTGCV